jgi:hypothetical protein
MIWKGTPLSYLHLWQGRSPKFRYFGYDAISKLKNTIITFDFQHAHNITLFKETMFRILRMNCQNEFKTWMS